jgi:hypothetical protein
MDTILEYRMVTSENDGFVTWLSIKNKNQGNCRFTYLLIVFARQTQKVTTMALICNCKHTAIERVERDPAFAKALLDKPDAFIQRQPEHG